MSRQEKRTRIKVVPPKLQLRGQDALTSSYPTNVRFSLDGRTGNYKTSYNDIQTIIFGTGSYGTSWQDNMVGYWTMQRYGSTGSNNVLQTTFSGETTITKSNPTYPTIVFNPDPGPVLGSKFTDSGIEQSYPYIGKGYDVNLQNIIVSSASGNLMNVVPNKSYEFNPYFSAFGNLQNAGLTFTNPLLIQDSPNDLFAFTGVVSPVPGKLIYESFSFAGWFFYDSTTPNSSNQMFLMAGPCRSSTFDFNKVDYGVSVYETATPGLLQFSIAFASGSVANRISFDSVTVNNLIGTWFHFAFTYDGRTTGTPVLPSSIKVYINGERLSGTITSFGSGFNEYNTSVPIQIGTSFLQLRCNNSHVFGNMADVAFFRGELTSDEVVELYNSRVPWHKKQRIIAGTSIILDNNPNPVEAGEYMTTFNRDGMLVTGSVVTSVGDNPEWVHFSPGQEMQPFHDQQQYAADAKGATVKNPFFATGSAETSVGEGFNSPLWSKNKIEIPMPVAADTELQTFVGPDASGFVTTNYSPMAYYNFTRKIWEPIGVGLPLNVSADVQDYFNEYPIGFPHSLGIFGTSNTINVAKNIAYCTNGLGFPFHPKYHATGSQVLDMSQYINEPFVLEKAVLELGPVKFELDKIDNVFLAMQKPVSASVATFFILNQRYNQNIDYKEEFNTLGIPYDVSASIPINKSLTKNQYDTSTTTRVDTIRDMVGFSQIFSIAGTTPLNQLVISSYNIYSGQRTGSLEELLPITSNDIVVRNQVSSFAGVQYTGLKPVFSMSMCTPTYGKNLIGVNTLAYNLGSTAIVFGNNGYRNSLGMLQPTTRGLVNDLFNTVNLEPKLTNFYKAFDIDTSFPTEKYRVNPYILYPQDKIILGCQMPISISPHLVRGAANIPGPEGIFTIEETDTKKLSPKLTLYGSYIRENKEYNDGTNQLLSSETIHEVIE